MKDIRAPLLHWYRHNARDLPWRRTSDPYAIWVSEIMCQQTRVDTVIPYYERFISRFPTTRSLAEADEDEVLAHWSGLGYYRRARLLHRGVRDVVANYGGTVPVGRQDRLGLPGVGKYTAGAIGSIAFDKEEPIVDGNVARVLCRIMRIPTPLGARETNKALWAYAEVLVQGAAPGDLNQSLMELGATVCTPTNPDCEACPVARHCQAHEHSEVAVLPVPRVRRPPKQIQMVAVVPVRAPRPNDGADLDVWMQRGAQRLFGGLWTVPAVEVEHSGPDVAAELLRAVGVRANLEPASVGQVRHTLTHRKIRLHAYRATHAVPGDGANGRFLSAEGRQQVGISTLTTKILRLAL